ncbi:putative NRPS-like protein biosynthetic cluster [Naganishia adeliensis]|uniref:NRPS-like protein biosynthetic cluster n=1 Tax=Naganishia adeliensis TaxID=92952 RepID=A0ACC2WV66_9TREE|nr:putative NRPS-like protein biosynthetic cluster [Naganishia adeliensis]
MSISYLVSTAGHAQYQNEQYPHNILSVNQLIREGAQELEDRPVVGFAKPQLDDKGREKKDDQGRILWECQRFSFKDLLALSAVYADELKKLGLVRDLYSLNRTKGLWLDKQDAPSEGQLPIISILAPTGPDFLVAWIACIGLGYGVVFIAPQCAPSAIAHLAIATESKAVLYHSHYTNLSKSASEVLDGIPSLRMPSLPLTNEISTEISSGWPTDPTDPLQVISHVFHTSGTSGTPKPIPHTHAASVSSLPRRRIGDPDTLTSSFTTTPLFHGGISDLLRAWMARSMLYLYPSSTTAVTAANVMGAFRACTEYPTNASYTPPISAFLSVPYILTLLSPTADPSDKEGATAMLARMEIVSTGGAPLDTAVGDGLVEKGVHLTSRLGSSECGFLLTSYRDFQNDSEWEWLRNDSPYAAALKFELSESDPTGRKSEMIVTSEWRSKVKSNRANGDYATGDLYERHPTKDNVWRYAGRGDDVVVLSNGEKFSPGPIESVFRSNRNVADALVVGVNQSQIGCLIFPRDTTTTNKLESALDGLIAQANQQSPSHAQLGREMCVILTSAERTKALPKSSKGTIQRGLAYDEFKPEIDRLYTTAEDEDAASGSKKQLEGKELTQWLIDRVRGIAGLREHLAGDDELQEDSDLFSWGIDSVKAARLRFVIAQNLDLGGNKLPLNVVFELADLCTALRTGQQHSKKTTEDDLQMMRFLVEKYSDFTSSSVNTNGHTAVHDGNEAKTVILTGATGSLGSHLLHQLVSSPSDRVKKVVCLVRGSDDAVALDRVKRALDHRKLEYDSRRFDVLAARLGKADLGVGEEAYLSLTRDADVIIHVSTRNLLDLAAKSASHKTRVLFCSSIASALNGLGKGDTVYEKLSEDPNTAVPIGYSQSKWVTEQICARANESDMLNDKVQVLRIGQLCGDTQEGMWNESEGWPLMIKTAQTTGTMPILQENPSWLPVDIAAQSV